MKAIGFANQYYTLWEIVKNEIPGESVKNVTCKFVKNISKTWSTVCQQYPNVIALA